MTTDMERELRELFREKAGEAPVATFKAPTSAPLEVLRRGRRRQVRTVIGSAAIALVLIVGSVAGLNTLLRGDADPFTTGQYEIFERTATIEAFTVTSPSDWFLVNEWPLSTQLAVGSGSASGECTAAAPGAGQPSPVCTSSEPSPQVEALPFGLPMLQLSNVDLGLNEISCGQDLPTNAAVLYVGLDYQRAIFGAKDPTIPEFPPGIGLPPEGDGPCGPGRYADFTVNGDPFFAWLGIGSDVSDQDRGAVETSYEMMSAIPDWEPVPPTETTPAYVIAGGTAETGDVWRLELRPSAKNVEFSLQGVEPGGSESDFTVPGVPVEWCCSYDGLTEVTFGAVSPEAESVELQPSDGSPTLPGTIVPLPPTLGTDFDLFFIEGSGGLDGDVVAIGLEDQPTEPPPTDKADEVRLSGAMLGQNWTARFTGAFGDETACIYVTFDEPFEPLCPGQSDTSLAGDWPSLHGTLGTRLFLLAGSVPMEVVDIRFTSDDGTSPPTELQCTEGPRGWTDPDKKVCAIALPPEGSGTLQYLDANGVVLFEEGNGWGSAQATSNAYPYAKEGGFVTARGSFQGADWKLEVLYYRDGYRLSIDGRRVFEGTLRGGEPVAFPIFQGDQARFDALVLLVDGGGFADHVSIASEGSWEGRWLPGSTANGGEARLWVFEVPGAGSGRLLVDGVDRGGLSWP